MNRIVVICQRDLFGRIAGYLVSLEQAGERSPLEERDTLSEAATYAQTAMTDYGATGWRIEPNTEEA